jgi:hypothetical protein
MCFDKVVEVEDWNVREFKYKNAYELYNRKMDFIDFYYYYEDITRVIRGYPKVHFRHLVTPQKELGGGLLPIFEDLEKVKFFLQTGEEDGRKSFEAYLEQYPDHKLIIPAKNDTQPD